MAQIRIFEQFSESQFISEKEAISYLTEKYQIEESCEFKKRVANERGISKWQQYHEGIPVLGAELIFESKGSQLFAALGSLATDFSTDQSETLEKGLIAGLNERMSCELSGKQDVWEFEKVYFSPEDSKTFYLSYLMHQKQDLCEEKKDLIIRASDGEILSEFSLIASCKSDTFQGQLMYNQGLQSMNVHFNGQDYELRDICRNDFDHPIITMSGANFNPVEIMRSKNNLWEDGIQIPAIQLHWGNSRFHDYLKDRFNRNSYDENGGRLMSILDSTKPGFGGFNYFGMYSMHGPVTYGSLNYWVSLDVIGHEWMHALLFHENVLKWTNESRALNEGICDIMGSMFEFETEYKYDSIKSGDWQIAEDVDNSPIRDLSNPKSLGNPDTYFSLTYLNSTDKYERSSVASYWFYLLSEGGSGLNDHQSHPYAYNLQGIGSRKALDILYRSITNYLSSTSEYIDLRRATQLASIDLFGQCSSEFQKLTEAWNAVGVYDSLKFCQTNTIENDANSVIRIYPNPADDILNIQIKNDKTIKELQLYSSNGMLLKKVLFQNALSNASINVSNVTQGIYILKLICDNQVIRQKVRID